MSPSFAAFAEGLASGAGQVLFRERVADLDTPVGAYLRLVQGRPNAFLLESVEGGAAGQAFGKGGEARAHRMLSPACLTARPAASGSG